MKKIKAIIVDDEKLGRELIKEYLLDHANIEIIAECRDARAAFQEISSQKPELVFLDIQMPEINGFELLEMLDELPQIIFSTAYDQYAIKAFEVNAVDYLLKPYDQERFNIALERALQKINTNQNPVEVIRNLIQSTSSTQNYLERILIKESGKIVIISCREIIYAEAMDDYVQLHTRKEAFLIQQSMNSLEARLNPDYFIRAHRSYIVNVDEIQEIVSVAQGRYVVCLKNGKEISLSRSGAKKIKRFSL